MKTAFLECLVDYVASARANVTGGFVLGVCGAQGSGKSTLAVALKAALTETKGLRTAVLSLDDLYLDGASRGRLARQVHPLFRTRGVPSTHDVALGMDVINHLKAGQRKETVWLPRFDKLTDEPRDRSEWEAFNGACDVVIFEGWCVGARPESEDALVEPGNALEREEDTNGLWRRAVNKALGADYAELFRRIDKLLFLAAPSVNVILEWRSEQERELVRKSGGCGMSDAELARFVAHYERLSAHILRTMPDYADIVVRLDERRRVLEASLR